jgi:hypothetical protein
MTIAKLLGIVVALAIIIIVAWAEWANLKRMRPARDRDRPDDRKPKKKGSPKRPEAG